VTYVSCPANAATSVRILHALTNSYLFLKPTFLRQDPPCTVCLIPVTGVAIVLMKMITERISHSSKVRMLSFLISER
jgi:hypothetical protein